MGRYFVLCGAIFGFLAVAAGAFGAHALRNRLSPETLDVYETAVRYQMYHAVALMFTGLLLARWYSSAFFAAGWLFLAGIMVFSGSLYILVLTGSRWLGAVTPLGGLAFLLGWACLAWGSVGASAR